MDTLRILIADDEAGMRHSIARALKNYKIHLPDINGEVGFEVASVPSGEEAVEIIDSNAPDILLLDHKMEGMSGLDVLQHIESIETDMLTVMITAFATIETAVRATKFGAFDFIAKPFTPEELKETIRKTASHLVIQRQAKRLAAEKRRVRFEFISVLGHELKAPLGAVEGYLGLLRDRAVGDDLSAYDEVVERCLVRAEGMRKLIADLLDLTRIESGEKRRELSEVDVEASAQYVLENVQPVALDRSIELNLETEGNLKLSADKGEIEIILNNLISNSVKYNRDNGKVMVKLVGDESGVVISVQDTGIGLSEAEAAKLFQDFVRIKNEHTRDIAGSGLGLSIVRKIAQLYAGDATVESEPGKGSTFTVTLKR